ncbi:MAG: enoyl-CoA hydratase/isomerase family protein [Deltaproteobacteria bacterium]|nr:enoyl-CoA hydratase/isomerase family protein [Deltaproteobacteria bacterium]
MTRLVRTEMLEDGRVQRVVLTGGKGNIFSTAMMAAVTAALDEHKDDPKLKLVVLEGEGAHFSFGASVEEHKKEQAPGMLAAFHRFIRGLAAHPVPVAALVRGQCLGGAFEVVCACHFVFCTSEAKFGCPEVKLGVFPPVLAAIGPLRLGNALSERLVVTGATIGAEEALRCGFATKIVVDEAELFAWYREHLAPLSAFAIRQATKVARRAGGMMQALEGALEAAERQYVAELLPSHDANEGIASFLERRKPAWEDR